MQPIFLRRDSNSFREIALSLLPAPIFFRHLRSLPRRGLGAITALSRDELRVFDSFSKDAAHRLYKAALVIVFAFVEPNRLLVAIPKQMKRLNVCIRSFVRRGG